MTKIEFIICFPYLLLLFRYSLISCSFSRPWVPSWVSSSPHHPHPVGSPGRGDPPVKGFLVFCIHGFRLSSDSPHLTQGLVCSLLRLHAPCFVSAPAHCHGSCLSKHEISSWFSFGDDKTPNCHFAAGWESCAFILNLFLTGVM